MSSSIVLHLEAGFLTKTEAHSFDLVCWSVGSGDSPVSDHNAGITRTSVYVGSHALSQAVLSTATLCYGIM